MENEKNPQQPGENTPEEPTAPKKEEQPPQPPKPTEPTSQPPAQQPPQPSKPAEPPPQKPPTTTVTPKPGPIISKPITRRELTAEEAAEQMDRRSFLKWLALGWGAFAAIVAGYGTLMLRFMFPNVLFEPKQSFTAGRIDDYIIGDVSEKFKERFGVWIVRDSEKLFALSTTCTHLGCTPNWLSNEGKFKCPCHGSGFYKNGINFEGPAPRPLERFKIALSDDGEIVIDKTKKFQQEKGEWNDPESYILA